MSAHLLMGLVLLLAAVSTRAQDAGDASANQPLMLVNPREAEALRRTLAAPVPPNATADALGRHFTDKDIAAERLGDKSERERVLREAIEHLPGDPRWPNNLAVVLKSQVRWDESRKFHEMAIERARHPADRLFYESNLMRLQQERGADDAVARAAQVRRDGEALLPGLKASNQRISVLRALGSAAAVEASVHSRRGEFNDALAAAAECERWNREALETAQALPDASAAILMRAASALAAAQRERAAALGRLGRFAEMQAVLAEHLQLIQRHPIDATFAAGAHQSLASLHLQRREFAQAERQLRLALQVLDSLGTPKTAPTRVSKVADLVLTLWARGLYAQARAEIDALDEHARRDKTPPARVRLAYERGLVDLMTGRPAQAAALFSDVARRHLASYGEGHYFVANARGLQGVALWLGGKPEQSEAAAELLKQAVFDHQLPRNADFLNDVALRKLTRELIFTTYLEAMAQRGGLQALLALGVADRLLDGVTAQAMADAAVRSSTHNTALAALVRQEQDLRIEMHALQQVLQSGSEPDALAEPDAARAKRRISELELTRQQVQERIRGRFPGYDRLVRPALPSATDVAQRLGRDEVLLLAVPTEKALYVWALTADELPTFARVDATLPSLRALVNRLRRSVEFAPGRGQLPVFDAQAAHELYRLVLAPVAARLQGRRHLIVASAGPLAMIPFAMLLAAPPTGQQRRLGVARAPDRDQPRAERQRLAGAAPDAACTQRSGALDRLGRPGVFARRCGRAGESLERPRPEADTRVGRGDAPVHRIAAAAGNARRDPRDRRVAESGSA